MKVVVDFKGGIFSMTRLKIKESEIQKVILDYLQVQENMGKLMFQRSNSLNVTTKDGHYIKTGKKGSPDILVWTSGRYYRGIYPDDFPNLKKSIRSLALEVKSESGKLSPTQKIWQDKFEKLGGEYYIVRSLEDVLKILKEF